MFYSKKVMLAKSHKYKSRGLQMVYNVPYIFMEKQQNRGISVHCKHKNSLLTEIYKTLSEKIPYFMKRIFT